MIVQRHRRLLCYWYVSPCHCLFLRSQDKVKISDIIQFRASLSYLNTPFPFSVAFGPADTRQGTIESTERVYNRLMLNSPDTNVLHFDTLALLAVEQDGTLDETKLKELIRLFRPDREGNLTLLDFAKSIDSVYKELRLLRASVANSSRIDKAFERIFNIFFYFIVGCVVLSVLGIDPLVLFASVSGFILGFAFMIGRYVSSSGEFAFWQTDQILTFVALPSIPSVRVPSILKDFSLSWSVVPTISVTASQSVT